MAWRHLTARPLRDVDILVRCEALYLSPNAVFKDIGHKFPFESEDGVQGDIKGLMPK